MSCEHGKAVAVNAVVEQQAVPEVFSFKVGKSLVVITNYCFEIIAYTLFRRCHCGKINLPLLTPALNWFLAKHLKHWLMDILPLRIVQCTSQFLNARSTIFGNSVLMTSS